MPIRKNLAVSRDPYLPWGGSEERAVCKHCGAVYRKKSWSVIGEAPSRQRVRSWAGRRGPVSMSEVPSRQRVRSWAGRRGPVPMSAATVLKGRAMRPVLCPACRKIRDRFPSGVVTLRGKFLQAHKDQILHLVRNEENRAVGVNPLERIISIQDRGDRVEIATTSERFAQRIGREIQRAYKGEVTYRWPGEDKQVRVDWQRDLS